MGNNELINLHLLHYILNIVSLYSLLTVACTLPFAFGNWMDTYDDHNDYKPNDWPSHKMDKPTPKPTYYAYEPRYEPNKWPSMKPKTPRPTKPEKTPKPTWQKTPKPTKEDKTPRPTWAKTPKPTKEQKTPRPTWEKTPRPTKKMDKPTNGQMTNQDYINMQKKHYIVIRMREDIQCNMIK